MTATLSADEVDRLRRDLDAAWTVAELAGPVTTSDLSIGGADVRISVVGDELGRALLPALEHHEPAAATPHALIGAWDAASVGTSLPSPASPADPKLETWMVRRDDEVVAQVERQSDGVIRVSDHLRRRYLLGIERAANLSWWEGAAPFRRQLHWAMAPEALPIHAAAVGHPDGVALIVGRGGSGKSSTAIASIRAGLGYVGDDYCVLRLSPTPIVSSLYATAKVTADELEQVGDLADTQDPDVGGGPKPVLFPLRRYPEQTLLQAPVRMLLLPEIGGTGRPTLEPASPAEALRALAPNSLMQLHFDGVRELRMLRRLVTSVPAHRLRLSSDRAANPELIREALDRPSARLGTGG
jgi:hypothetical protein